MVLWYLKQRSLPWIRAVEKADGAEAVGVGVGGVAAGQLQQGEQESLVEGVWEQPHGVVERPGSLESQKRGGLFWIEKSKSARKWPP